MKTYRIEIEVSGVSMFEFGAQSAVLTTESDLDKKALIEEVIQAIEARMRIKEKKHGW